MENFDYTETQNVYDQRQKEKNVFGQNLWNFWLH